MAFLSTKKEKVFLILFLSFLIIAIGAAVTAGIAFYQKYNMKKECENAITYADTMVRQSQTVIDATTCAREFYQYYTYFDADGSDESVPISVHYTLDGQSYGILNPTSSGASGSDKYEAMTSQVCKGLTTAEVISKLGLSSYIKNTNSISSADSSKYTDLTDDYIEFIYEYPTNVKNYMKFPLGNYSYMKSDASNIQTKIENNWLETIAVSSTKTSCETTNSSS